MLCRPFRAVFALIISYRDFDLIGPPQSGVSRLAGAIPAHEHAVVVDGVLVEEPALQETADHPRRDAPLAEVGKDPAVIRISRRQGERLWRLILLNVWPCLSGRIPRPPMEGQQILHRLREGLLAKAPQEVDGVPAGILRVPKPGPPVP